MLTKFNYRIAWICSTYNHTVCRGYKDIGVNDQKDKQYLCLKYSTFCETSLKLKLWESLIYARCHLQYFLKIHSMDREINSKESFWPLNEPERSLERFQRCVRPDSKTSRLGCSYNSVNVCVVVWKCVAIRMSECFEKKISEAELKNLKQTITVL